MTQKEVIRKLLRQRRPVTIREMFDSNIGYTGRNDVSDLRLEGAVIGQKFGKRHPDNAYLLVADVGEDVDFNTVAKLKAEGWRELPIDGELFRLPKVKASIQPVAG